MKQEVSALFSLAANRQSQRHFPSLSRAFDTSPSEAATDKSPPIKIYAMLLKGRGQRSLPLHPVLKFKLLAHSPYLLIGRGAIKRGNSNSILRAECFFRACLWLRC